MKLRARALIVPVVLGAAVALPVSGGSSAAAATPGFSIHFTAPPIAPAGSIAPGQGKTFTVTVSLNGAPDPGGAVYLGYQNGVPFGHVTGDNTAVPASQCGGQTSLPMGGANSSGGTVRCTADSNGRVVLTYFAPAQPPAQGRVDWIAWDSSSHPSQQAITHYVYTTVYRFNPSPVAPPASLAANASAAVTMTADDGLNHGVPGSTVFLSFKQTSGGGSAKVGSTVLTGTPTLFTADGGGAIQLTYTSPATLPSSGQDMIVAQDLPSPTGRNGDAYSFSAGAPVISVGDQGVVEGDQQPGIPANFSVTISAPQPNPVTVQYLTICGIGDKGCSEDFPQVSTPVSVTIPANATTTTFIVRQFSYVGGGAGETYPEGWFVELLNPSVGVVGRAVGTGVLLPDVENSNQVVPYLSVGDGGLAPTTATGGTQLWFTVTLGGLQGSDVTFSYATADGSALAGHDYAGIPSGTATIPAGKSYTVIKVTLLPNAPPPSSRTFTLTISNPSPALTISRAQGTGTVLSS